MKTIDLRTKVILQCNELDMNNYDGKFSVTKNIVDDAAKELNLSVIRDSTKKMTNIYYKNKQIGYLKGLKVSTTSREAFNICRNKFKLENYLTKMKLSTLTSKHFVENEKELALKYIENDKELTYVLKPLHLAGGDGIELDISAKNFSEMWNRSISVQKSKKVREPSCIVQPFVKGFDIRVSIIEGQYSSAILRLPAHVIGDGTKTISDLIEEKNSNRIHIPYFKKKLIPINRNMKKRLSDKGYTLESVLNSGNVLVLSDISNLTLGGESIDITSDLSDEIKALAIHSVASIPGMSTGGVDIMTEDFKGKKAYIIEVNTNANHTMHHLPLKGNATRPFYDLLQNLLIRYKVENGLELSSIEREKYQDIYAFDKLKINYNNELFRLTGV